METKIHNRFYDRLTADNAALLLVDHQLGLFTGIRDIDIAQLKHNVVGLAKAAKVLGISTIVTTTSRDSLWGPTIPELTEVLSGVEMLGDNASPKAMDLYASIDMPFATLVGQLFGAYSKARA